MSKEIIKDIISFCYDCSLLPKEVILSKPGHLDSILDNVDAVTSKNINLLYHCLRNRDFGSMSSKTRSTLEYYIKSLLMCTHYNYGPIELMCDIMHDYTHNGLAFRGIRINKNDGWEDFEVDRYSSFMVDKQYARIFALSNHKAEGKEYTYGRIYSTNVVNGLNLQKLIIDYRPYAECEILKRKIDQFSVESEVLYYGSLTDCPYEEEPFPSHQEHPFI